MNPYQLWTFGSLNWILEYSQSQKGIEINWDCVAEPPVVDNMLAQWQTTAMMSIAEIVYCSRVTLWQCDSCTQQRCHTQCHTHLFGKKQPKSWANKIRRGEEVLLKKRKDSKDFVCSRSIEMRLLPALAPLVGGVVCCWWRGSMWKQASKAIATISFIPSGVIASVFPGSKDRWRSER